MAIPLRHINILWRRRTLENISKQKQAQKSLSFLWQSQKLEKPLQKFDYFLILDFESTCDGKKCTLVPQEIIEFPVLKVNGKTFKIESVFHKYVQPSVHRILTPYCIKLTGIIQDMIDGQPHLDEILQEFHMWLEKENLLTAEVKSAFVTYTDWDLNKMLPSQCEYLGVAVPSYMKTWINIQQSFIDETGHWPTTGLKDAMKHLNVSPLGRFHSGIDDCKNTLNIMKALADKGHIFTINGPRVKKLLK